MKPKKMTLNKELNILVHEILETESLTDNIPNDSSYDDAEHEISETIKEYLGDMSDGFYQTDSNEDDLEPIIEEIAKYEAEQFIKLQEELQEELNHGK